MGSAPLPLPAAIGRFRIEALLGRGGMGEVYRAFDPKLERVVAIKTVRPDVAQPQFLERFNREAQALARLSHPNIVVVHDAGEVDGVVYIAMEYLKGEDLAVLLKRGALPFEERLQILTQVLSALEHAHAENVIHRDIKPSNILRQPDGTIKLVDFGLARIAAADSLTMTGAVMATVQYASPEQLRGMPLDRRTDIYSVGAVAYEICSGRCAFVGDNDHVSAIMLRVISDPLPPMNTPWSLKFPELEQLVGRAMAKDREARFQTAKEMRQTLTAFLSSAHSAIVAVGTDETLLVSDLSLVPPPTPPPASEERVTTGSDKTVVAPPPSTSTSQTTVAGSRPPAQLPEEPRSDTVPAGRSKDGPLSVGWIVGGVAAAVLVGALLFMRGSEEPAPSAQPAPSSDTTLLPQGEVAAQSPAPPVPSTVPPPVAENAPSASPTGTAAGAPATTPAASSTGSPAAPKPAVPTPAPPSAAATVATTNRGAAPPVASPPPPASRPRTSAKTMFYGDGAAGASGSGAVVTNAGMRYRLIQQAGAGEIDVDPDTTFKSGDRVRFSFESNIEGYLYVVQQGSSGRWTVLFPNARINGGKNAIRPFEQYPVPPGAWFLFDATPGTEEIFVFLSKEPMSQLPGFDRPVTRTETVSASVVGDLQKRVLSRDLVLEEDHNERAASGGAAGQATYVVNRDELGKAVSATIRLNHGQ